MKVRFLFVWIAASMGLLWGGLAVGFGLLGLRATRVRTAADMPAASTVPAT